MSHGSAVAAHHRTSGSLAVLEGIDPVGRPLDVVVVGPVVRSRKQEGCWRAQRAALNPRAENHVQLMPRRVRPRTFAMPACGICAGLSSEPTTKVTNSGALHRIAVESRTTQRRWIQKCSRFGTISPSRSSIARIKLLTPMRDRTRHENDWIQMAQNHRRGRIDGRCDCRFSHFMVPTLAIQRFRRLT
jgi:hypothetical protein